MPILFHNNPEFHVLEPHSGPKMHGDVQPEIFTAPPVRYCWINSNKTYLKTEACEGLLLQNISKLNTEPEKS